jgi:hypothetical protein
MKRFITAFITIALLSILLSVYATAEEYECMFEDETMNIESEIAASSAISLRYTDIGFISANLSINSDTAYCSGRVQTATSGATTSVSVRLQRSTNGTSWSTIKTWSGTGTNSSDVSGQHTVSSGYQYRVSVYGRVLNQNGNVLESATKNSSVKTN